VPDFSIIKVEDTHKAIKATKNAVPKTIEAVDSIVSSTLNILGFLPNTINEYMKYSLDKTKEKLYQKLNNVPSEKIVPPPVHIAAPAFQAACYAADCDQLHNMFADLLASAMNADKQKLVHPAFIEIIKQLSPDEARIISNKSFIGAVTFPMCTFRLQEKGKPHILGNDFRTIRKGSDLIMNLAIYPAFTDMSNIDLQRISSISDNLSRLHIITIHKDRWVTDPKQYADLIALFKEFENKYHVFANQELACIPASAEITAFGQQFLQACVL